MDGEVFDINNTEQLVNNAQKYGKELCDAGLKTHQLRRIYDTVQSIHSQAKGKTLNQAQQDSLKFLKPLLAYVASKRQGLIPLQDNLVKFINTIDNDPKKLDRLYKYLQSILAYHKYYEEKKKREEE